MKRADCVIIGSGQGGVALADKLAENGRDVVLFERLAWGGTCVNTGCVPSKTLLASAHAAAAAGNARALGIRSNDVKVDFNAVMDRVQNAIQPQGIAKWLNSAGVELVEAEAKFIAPHTVQGGDVTVEADTIIINTGKSPFVPDIPGLADTPYLTYQSFWELKELPEQLVVMGAGYTGLELAQAMQRLGSQVHIIEIADRPIADEEEDVSRALQKALEADGVRFHLHSTVQEVAYQDEQFRVTVDTAVDPLVGDALLVATGRRPNVDALGAAKWGIARDEKGHIQVDDQFQTTIDGVYAIGDVTGQPAFTHVSWEDHRRLLSILNGNGRQRGDRVLGYAFFTEPQVGRAGLTLSQATDRGFKARSATLPLTEVSRAITTDHTDGFYRLVIDDETDRILGATLVGPQTAELIHIIMALMEAGATWQVLERSQAIHPAYAQDLPVLARKFKR